MKLLIHKTRLLAGLILFVAAANSFSQISYYGDFVFVYFTDKHHEKVADAEVFIDGIKMEYVISKPDYPGYKDYLLDRRKFPSIKEGDHVIKIIHPDYLPYERKVGYGDIVLAKKGDLYYYQYGAPIAYTPHPEYLMLIQFSTKKNSYLRKVVDSLGLVIDNSYSYCGGKWPGGAEITDTNVFIVCKKDKSPFADSACGELKALRQLKFSAGPLVTASDKPVAWKMLTNKIDLQTKNGNSTFIADEGMGNGMLEVARRLLKAEGVVYVSNILEAMACTCD
jgi:hypothetical protein